jgi:periplasmic divalent cation tolerance protein
MTIIAVLTTIDNEDRARTIATELVRRKLAACVQVSQIESVYTWEGQVQQTPEFRLLVKTTSERYTAVEEAIRELHDYDLPAIVGFEMPHAYEPFAEWVTESVGGQS